MHMICRATTDDNGQQRTTVDDNERQRTTSSVVAQRLTYDVVRCVNGPLGRWLLWNINRKSWMPDRMVSYSMTLSHLT